MSDAKDREDERGKDLCDDDCGSMIPVWGQAAVYDARVLTAIAEDPLRLAWLAWAPADRTCERRRDGHRDLAQQGFRSRCKAWPQHPDDQDAFGRDLELARASNGTTGGRLQEFVTDVSSKWIQDTGKCQT